MEIDLYYSGKTEAEDFLETEATSEVCQQTDELSLLNSNSEDHWQFRSQDSANH